MVDWGLDDGPLTVAAYTNGDIEILAGSGFGATNDNDNPDIRAAAIALVKTAERHAGAMRAATDYPLPPTGNFIFYLLTNSGTFTAQESERALAAGSSPMSDIGAATLNAYKLLEKAKEGQPLQPIQPLALTGPWSTV